MSNLRQKISKSGDGGGAVAIVPDGNGRQLKIKFADLTGPDSDGDTYEINAFQINYGKNIPLGGFGHNQQVLPYGVGQIRVDGMDVIWEGQVLDSPHGKDAYEYFSMMGMDGEISFNFLYGQNKANTHGGLHFYEVKVLSVDGVLSGAGFSTGVMESKSDERTDHLEQESKTDNREQELHGENGGQEKGLVVGGDEKLDDNAHQLSMDFLFVKSYLSD